MDHPLQEFLDAVGDDASDFARRLGVRPRTLQRILAGEEFPTPSLARRIVDSTDGAVPFDALYGAAGAADLGARRKPDDALDQELFAEVLQAAISNLLGAAAESLPFSDIDMIAEAVANTYATMARVTTRRDMKDRVAQALRPVLEEILKDCAVQVSPPRLAETARCIAALYCEALSRRSPR